MANHRELVAGDRTDIDQFRTFELALARCRIDRNDNGVGVYGEISGIIDRNLRLGGIDGG